MVPLTYPLLARPVGLMGKNSQSYLTLFAVYRLILRETHTPLLLLIVSFVLASFAMMGWLITELWQYIWGRIYKGLYGECLGTGFVSGTWGHVMTERRLGPSAERSIVAAGERETKVDSITIAKDMYMCVYDICVYRFIYKVIHAHIILENNSSSHYPSCIFEISLFRIKIQRKIHQFKICPVISFEIFF